MANIEEGIWANCSEATIRIRTSMIDKKIIKKLVEKLAFELADHYDRQNEGPGDWDDEEIKREFDWSEGYICEDMLFGIEHIKISGDAPYNFGNEIEEVIKRYISDPDMEYSE